MADLSNGAILTDVSASFAKAIASMGLGWWMRRELHSWPTIYMARELKLSAPRAYWFSGHHSTPDSNDSAHQRITFVRHTKPLIDRIQDLSGILNSRLHDLETDFRIKIMLTEFRNGSLHARLDLSIAGLSLSPNPLKPAEAGKRIDAFLDGIERIARLNLPSDFSDPDRTAGYCFDDASGLPQKLGLRGAAADLARKDIPIQAKSAHQAWMIRELWLAIMTGKPEPELTSSLLPSPSVVAFFSARARLPGHAHNRGFQ